MRTFLQNMERVYKIKNSISRTNNDITLIRISACFAGFIVKEISQGHLLIITTILPHSIANGFHNFMCMSTFGSLLPIPSATNFNEAEAITIYKVYCWHKKIFDAINSSNRQNASKASLGKYVKIQYHSSLYTTAQRDDIAIAT